MNAIAGGSLVHGRTGHLEIFKLAPLVSVVVHGRTGHLENLAEGETAIDQVHGRTGHLERNGW